MSGREVNAVEEQLAMTRAVFRCTECGREHAWDPALVECPDKGRPTLLPPLDPLPLPRLLEAGDRVAERYLVETQIGEGGMGAVYRAYDADEERLVAVKVLAGTDGGTPLAWRRFAREAALLARIDDPGIVHTHEYGFLRCGNPFLVMELLEGHSLADFLKTDGPLEEPELRTLGRQLLEVLARLHAMDIVHRDLKPGNLFVCDDGSVRLLDFGLSRDLSDPATRVTKSGIVAGTPVYMAPELLLGQSPSKATDVYAIAACFYALLAGAPPHRKKGEGLAQTLKRMMNEPAPVDIPALADVSPQLKNVLRCGLSRTLANRYADAAEMCEEWP